MNKRRLLHFLALATVWPILCPTVAAEDFPQGSPAFKTDFKEALRTAKAAGKPLAVIFGASWCPHCMGSKADIYPSALVRPYHEKFVWVYLDVEEKVNQSALQQFGVQHLPHLQLLNKDGKPLSRSVGITVAEEFAKVLETALKKK